MTVFVTVALPVCSYSGLPVAMILHFHAAVKNQIWCKLNARGQIFTTKLNTSTMVFASAFCVCVFNILYTFCCIPKLILPGDHLYCKLHAFKRTWLLTNNILKSTTDKIVKQRELLRNLFLDKLHQQLLIPEHVELIDAEK